MASKRSAVVASRCRPSSIRISTLPLLDDVEVGLAEVLGRDGRDERLELRDDHALDGRVDADGAGGDARAQPDHEHAARPLGNERRQMAEHALQAHVLRVGRRLRFAGVVVGQRAVRFRGDGDRRRETLADVNDVGVEAARRQESAEGDELRRQRLHRERGDREQCCRGSACKEAAGSAALARCREQCERRSRAREDHELLRPLAADRDDQHECRAERADDGAERVGRVEPADRAPRLRPGRHCGRERQRKARAPEQRRR